MLFVLASAFLVAGAPAEAPVAVHVATAKPEKDKKICRSDVSTGSIMPKRVCKTAQEWAAMQRNAGLLDQMRQQQTTNQMMHSTTAN